MDPCGLAYSPEERAAFRETLADYAADVRANRHRMPALTLHYNNLIIDCLDADELELAITLYLAARLRQHGRIEMAVELLGEIARREAIPLYAPEERP